MESGKVISMSKNDIFLKTAVKLDKKTFSFTWSIGNFSLLTDKLTLSINKKKSKWYHNSFTRKKQRVFEPSTEKLLPSKGIKSSEFITADSNNQKASWKLVIWPWVVDSDNYEFLAVWLMSVEKLHDFSQVNAVLSIINSQREKCFLKHMECVEGSEWRRESKNISRKILLENQEMLLPNDTLTIHCELEITFKLSLETVPDGYAQSLISSTIFSDLKTLLELQKNCDVTLVCDGVKFKAHRNVLSDRCEVFDRMFENKMVENDTGVVKIDDITSFAFEKLLNFIYGMEIEVPMSICIELYYGSDKYNLKELMQHCSEILKYSLNVDNAFEIAVAADMHNDDDLFWAAKTFIKSNSSEVLSKKLVDNVMQHPRVAKRLFE